MHTKLSNLKSHRNTKVRAGSSERPIISDSDFCTMFFYNWKTESGRLFFTTRRNDIRLVFFSLFLLLEMPFYDFLGFFGNFDLNI